MRPKDLTKSRLDRHEIISRLHPEINFVRNGLDGPSEEGTFHIVVNPGLGQRNSVWFSLAG